MMVGTRTSNLLRRITTLLIICCLAAVVLSPNTAAALPGSGTQEDPYRIESLADFDQFASDPNYWSGFTRLEADVNLAGRTYSRAVIAQDGVNSFSGIFDGNNHRITGARITRYGSAGLFGFSHGEIRNLGIENATVIGSDYVGALVALNEGGRIVNCYSTGSVSGCNRVGGLAGHTSGYTSPAIILNCFSSCTTRGDDYVGGLVGSNAYGGIVSNCKASGTVNGEDYVGGLIGYNEGIAAKCVASGDVTADQRGGGLIGQNLDRVVSTCYSTGDVSGGRIMGGLIGENKMGCVWRCFCRGNVTGEAIVGGLLGSQDGVTSSAASTVANCYSTGDISASYLRDPRAGGLIGMSHNGGVSNCFWDTESQTHGITVSIGNDQSGIVVNLLGLSTNELQTEATFISAGWDFLGESANGTSETWQMNGEGQYPTLSFFSGDVPFPLSGSGDESDPYLIGDASQLGMLSWYPEDCYFRLTNDIDMSGGLWSIPVVPAFGGCLHGGSHKVVNLEISGITCMGFFGRLGECGKVIDLRFEGGSIHAIGLHAGAVAGWSEGGISNCYSSMRVSGWREVGGLIGHNAGGSIAESHFDGYVSGDRTVGGIVGYSYSGIISGCSSTGDIRGGDVVGGLVASNETGMVFACYSNGIVAGTGDGVGGFAAVNSGGIIRCCYSMGYANGVEAVGGMVGNNGGGMSDCYSVVDVNGLALVGGLVGTNNGAVVNCFWDTESQSHGVTESAGESIEGIMANVVRLSTADMQMRSTFTSAGWDFVGESANGTTEWWQMPDDAGYPVLNFPQGEIPFPLEGTGTATDPYLIGDAKALGMINWYAKDSSFKLTNDIDLRGISWSGPVVAVFQGSFDGGGHRLLDIRISGTGWLGVFGRVGEGGQIRHLGVEDGIVSGLGGLVGGLVGYNIGSNLADCHFDGNVAGWWQVGGLVGSNGSSVLRCYSKGNVSGDWDVGGIAGYAASAGSVSECYSVAAITGTSNIGGLVGYNYSAVSDSYSMGDVSGVDAVGGLVGSHHSRNRNIVDCYSTGDVNGVENVGGLVGFKSDGTIRSSFWDVNTSGSPTSAGGTPKTTAEMKMESTFTSAGWDFIGEIVNGPNDIWAICEGTNYPRFVYQIPQGDIVCPDGVNSFDFALLARYWHETDCAALDDCEGADIDLSGAVDFADVAAVAESWLRDVRRTISRPSPSPLGLRLPRARDGGQVGLEAVSSVENIAICHFERAEGEPRHGAQRRAQDGNLVFNRFLNFGPMGLRSE